MVDFVEREVVWFIRLLEEYNTMKGRSGLEGNSLQGCLWLQAGVWGGVGGWWRNLELKKGEGGASPS